MQASYASQPEGDPPSLLRTGQGSLAILPNSKPNLLDQSREILRRMHFGFEPGNVIATGFAAASPSMILPHH